MKLFGLREEFGKTVPKDSVLYSAGDAADMFYVVMRGRVVIDRPVWGPSTAAPGDVFGEIEVFSAKPRTGTATAADDCQLLAFNKDTAIKLAEATPSFALVVIRKSSERVYTAEDMATTGTKPSGPKVKFDRTKPAAAAAEPEGPQVGPVTTVEYANSMFKKDQKCPNCRTTFAGWSVRSNAINLTGRDDDFMNHYSGVDPNWYAVWVCPSCNLAAYADDFSKMQSFQIARVKPKLEAAKKADPRRFMFQYYRDLDLVLRSYQLALPFYDGVRGGAEKTAGLYHRMAWVERTRGNAEEEKGWLAKAREFYEKAFTTSDAGKQGVLWAYLIAELDMRIGKYKDAVKWFGTAAQQPDFKEQPLLEKMVRDRWSEAGDLSKTSAE